jgi:hypothetical protein
MVAHTYNPNYSGDGNREDGSSRTVGQKVSETPSQPKSQAQGMFLSSQLQERHK